MMAAGGWDPVLIRVYPNANVAAVLLLTRNDSTRQVADPVRVDLDGE